jgi:hypothetical protein
VILRVFWQQDLNIYASFLICIYFKTNHLINRTSVFLYDANRDIYAVKYYYGLRIILSLSVYKVNGSFSALL